MTLSRQCSENSDPTISHCNTAETLRRICRPCADRFDAELVSFGSSAISPIAALPLSPRLAPFLKPPFEQPTNSASYKSSRSSCLFELPRLNLPFAKLNLALENVAQQLKGVKMGED